MSWNTWSLLLLIFTSLVLSEVNPIPSEDIVTHFNELRQDIVLLYELKLALANCEYELQTLRHRYETLAPGKVRNSSEMPKLFTDKSNSVSWYRLSIIKMEMSFWAIFATGWEWLCRKLPTWQLPVQLVMKILSKWSNFQFSDKFTNT